MYAGALDACISSQTLLATDTAPHEALKSLSEGISLPKDVVKGLMASAWAADLDAQHAQAARLAALRVHASMLLPGAVEPSKASPFAKGVSNPSLAAQHPISGTRLPGITGTASV